MFQKLINIVYPNRCIICGDFTKSALNICDECTPKIEIITETTCKKCGLPQKACECSRFTYHFKALTAPFINDGAMKSGIYNLKFNGYADAALFYAKFMAQFINKKFSGVDFDCVCEVPMRGRDRRHRGYNQAELLAKHTAKLLNIPHQKRLLIKTKNTKTQHSQNMEQRWMNIRNVFAVNSKYDVTGKTVLLIDDIKTTGATLDECARTLKLKGALEVYCATALITV